MREIDIVAFLLERSPELSSNYSLYQDIKTAIKLKIIDLLDRSIAEPDILIYAYIN